MERHSLVRAIYLYIFAILGLVLLTIGSVRFVDMALKAFVFTRADEEQRTMYKQPSMYYPIEKVEGLQTEEGLTEDEKSTIKMWLEDYKSWKESSLKIDYVTSQRHRDASNNLALILVGLPLYLYHWGVIKRELRKQEKE